MASWACRSFVWYALSSSAFACIDICHVDDELRVTAARSGLGERRSGHVRRQRDRQCRHAPEHRRSRASLRPRQRHRTSCRPPHACRDREARPHRVHTPKIPVALRRECLARSACGRTGAMQTQYAYLNGSILPLSEARHLAARHRPAARLRRLRPAPHGERPAVPARRAPAPAALLGGAARARRARDRRRDRGGRSTSCSRGTDTTRRPCASCSPAASRPTGWTSTPRRRRS